MLELFLKSFLTLFVVVDPVGLVPVFLALAGDRPPRKQAQIARKAVLVAGGLMVSFFFFGRGLLEYLGISLEALRIAGGILLFRIATEMVFAHHERETEEEKDEARLRADISVFPLAIPLIAGPGALASVLILALEARKEPLGYAVVLSTVVLVLALAYVFLRLAVQVRRALGRTGVNVVTRVLGILLAALAVQYVADGVKALF
ncbi:MarC family protein [Thermus amyloliquefaciens]|uniref:MarC family protein n=1 Tax=Thermus amyloliquefaciens TaxID=1449080 RepID=UPI00056E825A|nr:MarC family protein [Thermus amyloliquefaciens]